jgi:hypothetical protein
MEEEVTASEVPDEDRTKSLNCGVLDGLAEYENHHGAMQG